MYQGFNKAPSDLLFTLLEYLDGLLQLLLFGLIAKHLFQWSGEYACQLEGQFDRRRVVPLFDGHYGLSGYLYLVCQLLLGHLFGIKTQPADVVLYFACAHLRFLSCKNRFGNHSQ